MERIGRKRFQGITNIIRFNRHYYIAAFILIAILLFIKNLPSAGLNIIAAVILLLIILSIIISLAVSYYIYDYSDLYSLNWLNSLDYGSNKQLVNINAGFDETSSLLKEKHPCSTLLVFDFYDPRKHTEISIERARKAYPIFPGTKTISTDNVPLQVNSIDCIFLVFVAHEIRNDEERIEFFDQLKNTLCPEGRIVVTEHLRDINNFIAYNFGFFHFYSKNTWQKNFASAGLTIESEIKITPFISNFILKKNGIAS